ncbi:phage portal protein family protein [Hymenobacter rubripertinctus]|uniref:DUF935 family protein n=1 Tax=Hymenobacter rubripertinctus TaxID=2029981 RepID=A0A418QMN4_9BACT|nr:DUF935 family protein [Hymenobacter rubripertinctus]RIY06473.1 DUF935 family protein [Hymenobacter rubripertinctus]
MSFLDRTLDRVTEFVLSRVPDGRIFVENRARMGEAPGQSASAGIVPEAISQRAISLQEWTAAVNAARHPLVRNRRQLYLVFDGVMLDLHLTSLMDKRTEKLQANKFKIVAADNTEQPELTTLFQTLWFRDFIRFAIESVAYGHSLIELFDQADQPVSLKIDKRTVQYFPLRSVKLVPRPHVRPEAGQWVVNTFDQEGSSFRADAVRHYYLEAGRPADLGLLYKITPVALAKRYALGHWSEYNEKLGLPFRSVVMPRPDKKREERLAQILAKMGSAGWGIFHAGEEMKLLESAKTDPHKCFLELLNYCDRQMSKVISGETLTTDEGSGSKSQATVHLEVAELKHEADRTFLEYLINEELIPRLNYLGYPLQGCRYVRDDSMEMSPQEQIKIDGVLLTFYNLDPAYIADKYDIPIESITGKSAAEVEQVLTDAVSKKAKPAAKGLPLPANQHAPTGGCCTPGRIAPANMRELPAGAAVPTMSAEEDAYLRAFYDNAGSRGWSYDSFRRTHSKLLAGVAEGLPAAGLSVEYGADDHLVRANFEADVHRFGHNKTVFQVLQLNQLLKDSLDFDDFQKQAGKVLANLNERNLRTEYEMAKATSTQTASAMRAVADGAQFMRYKATLDDKTRPFHAALHNRVFSLATDDWRKFVAPLGWNCRCHNIYEDDHDGELTTYEDAIGLLGTDEVTRLTRDGFLIDRIDKKKLFTDRQNYMNGLPDPEQVKFQIGKLKYSEQGQERWKDLTQTNFPAHTLQNKSKQDALDDFEATAMDKVKRYVDHRGMPVFLREKELQTHLKPKYLASDQNRQQLYFDISAVLSDPDEVYFFDKSVDANNGNPAGPNAKLSYLHLKFYQDDVVLGAVVGFDEGTPQSLQTWYQVRPNLIDEARRGLLVHKK